MANFLFIHGAMHGAWCWAKVTDILEGDGHHYLDLDLPGAGLDRTPRKDIIFDDYIERIDHFIEMNDIKDINLVGHSLAGMLLPKIALDERAGVTNVIFLAAYVMNKGESLLSQMPEEKKKIVFDSAEKSEDNTYLPGYEHAVKSYLSDLDEDSRRNYYNLLTPQPLAPCLHKSDVDLSLILQPMHYIRCTRDVAVCREFSDSFINKINCEVHELDAHHDVMLSHPKELAKLLEKISL